MATHELPEWEAPPASAQKTSIFHRASNPFTINNPFSSQSASSSEHKKSFFSRQSPLTRTENFDKETGAGISAEVTEMSRSRRNYFGWSRRTWLLILLGIILLLVLIIGLAVGLHKKSSQNLPLPTNDGIFTGDLTYYSPGPGYGACGYENTSEDSICAVSHIIWDAASTSSNPNNNPLCGRKIRITRYDESVGGNRSADVEVVDRCVGCKATDLDLSLKVFDSLAEESQGRVVGSWAWLD